MILILVLIILLLNTGIIELNGNADFTVRFNALNTALQTFITDLNTKLVTAFTGVGGTWPGTSLDISGAKVEEVKIEQQEKNKDEEEDKFAEIEDTVLETIKQIEGENGASWDEITEKCEKAGLEKDSIEEALTSLMDKGLIYEPILGTIKTT